MGTELQVVTGNNGSLMLEAMRVEDLVRQVALIQQVMAHVMKEGTHFGVIPGTRGNVLYKAGAEKLGFVFRLAPEFVIDERQLETGHREYRVTCRMQQIGSGAYIGSGVGACTTMEGKYRYRTGPRTPTGRAVPSEYWTHRTTNPDEAQRLIGGKGFFVAKNQNGQWEIHQGGGKVDYENPADYYNTVLKMAKKRAHVDAILTCTAASDIFTQDLEELEEMDFPQQQPSSAQSVVNHSKFQPPPASRDAQAAPTQTPTQAPERRQEQPSAEGSDWRTFIVPKFVKKSAGRPMGEMTPTDLAWWGKNYVPKGFGNKPPSESDHAFRRALDVAMKEMRQHAGETVERIRDNIDQGEDVPM